MRCKRCNKTITEQTVRIYGGRCVPCHRKRLSQRFPRIFPEMLSFIRFTLTIPINLASLLVYLIPLWLAPLPFTRREVSAIIEPVYGSEAALEYFKGLRSGFVNKPVHTGPCFSDPLFFSLGVDDGYKIKCDLSQWPRGVQNRATKPIDLA
ncbi:hypothetical protein SAMN02745166_03117 [Prosthecobacter debontii]|uniref:Uncharacterized protein n=1 Tax=Prosthecobacter debontii TaxID=48467 RepID=A0A1T4YFH0_9BACT|nr:hypothetical protein SAMN02745166_03117 [Prosthecobacter debontii]